MELSYRELVRRYTGDGARLIDPYHLEQLSVEYVEPTDYVFGFNGGHTVNVWVPINDGSGNWVECDVFSLDYENPRASDEEVNEAVAEYLRP